MADPYTAPTLGKAGTSTHFYQSVLEDVTFPQHVNNILGLLQSWHAMKKSERRHGFFRLCDYVTFSCRESIWKGFQHDSLDGCGFFELLTMHEDTGITGFLNWRRDWQRLDEDEMAVLRDLYLSIGSNEWSNEINEQPFYETHTDRKRFHRLLRCALLNAFNGINELMQRAEEVQSASKEHDTSRAQLEKMYDELELVGVVASRIYTFDNFTRTLTSF